jgi:hypothetical protein
MINWILPLMNQQLTDIAAHFVWEAADGAVSYTLEYGSHSTFTGCTSVKVDQIAGCRVGFYLPEDHVLPPKGEVYVRLLANTGERSETLRFICDDVHTKAPLKWEMSTESPYFTLMDYGQHDWKRVYEILPDTIKPYTAILPIPKRGMFGTPVHARLPEHIMESDEEGYPWHLVAAGPITVYGENLALIPLSTLEYVLQHAKHLRSVGLLEQYMGVRPPGDMRVDYFNRIIMLCGKYGYHFLYTDGNRNEIDFATVVKRPDFMNILREYKDYVTLSYKQNHANASYTCMGAILGAWIDNACGHVGIQGENWYWNDAGFCDDPGGYHGYLQGNEQQIPPCFTAQMLLAGLSYGACYYSMEGAGWTIQARGNSDLEWSPQGLAAISLLQTIIQNKLIPSKEQVIGKMKAAVTAKGLGKELGDAWVGGKFRKTFQNIYGIDHTKELFFKQSRYYHLPFVTDRVSSFAQFTIINADEIIDPYQINRILDPLYPQTFTGNSYISDAGHTYIIMNSNENIHSSQYISVNPEFAAGEPKLLTKLEGAFSLWQYMLMWQKGGVLHALLNAPAESMLSLRFYMIKEPKIKILDNGGLSCGWNPQESCLEITLKGNNQCAEILCTAGEFTSACIEPVRNRKDTNCYLSDLPFTRVVTEGKWLPVKNQCANETYGKLPTSINGLRYPHSFSFMRNTEIAFDLAGKYRHLEFNCGFDIDAWLPIILDRDHIIWDRPYKDIDLRFTLLGDNNTLYESPVLNKTNWNTVVSVDITGVKTLTFSLKGNIIPSKFVYVSETGAPAQVRRPMEEVLTDVESTTLSAEVYMDIGNPILT